VGVEEQKERLASYARRRALRGESMTARDLPRRAAMRAANNGRRARLLATLAVLGLWRRVPPRRRVWAEQPT